MTQKKCSQFAAIPQNGENLQPICSQRLFSKVAANKFIIY